MAVGILRAADGCQVLEVGKLAGLGECAIRGKWGQLVPRSRIAVRRSCLGGIVPIGRDLLRALRILAGFDC